MALVKAIEVLNALALAGKIFPSANALAGDITKFLGDPTKDLPSA
jgi:hypothetical protein